MSRVRKVAGTRPLEVVFADVDRSRRGACMEASHGISVQVANDVLAGANRVAIIPTTTA